MEEKKQIRTINLTIGHQVYPINIVPESEEIFRNAAKLINEKLAKYEQKLGRNSSEKYLAISALDFAVSSLLLKDRQDTKPFINTIKELSSEIEEILSNNNF